MSSLEPTDPLVAALAEQAASPAAAFRRLWQRSDPPELESFVSARAPLLTSELAALVRIDLRERYSRAEPVTAEDYFARFPQLQADAELAVDVIYTEFLAREEAGQEPAVEEFQRRFPDWAEVLANQIELHWALDEPGPLPKGEEPGSASTVESAGHGASWPDRANRLEADYQILEEIGRGGMGVVYRAKQRGLNRYVALKMVRAVDGNNQQLLARFRAEAEVVASLHHPNIVQIYDYGQHRGLPYLALEFVEHGTLAARLDGKPWAPRQAAALIAELARAVQFAHDRRVIHRDLKPANLLIASEDRGLEIKIADFGLAKVFRDVPSGHTETGVLLGTPGYMAPEQARGHARYIGPATDVYALGAILYELLSGRPPFRGETAIETVQQVLSAEPPLLKTLVPSVARDLATICAKCLNREPERRYASAADLADDLARFLADQPIHARPTSRLEHGWRWCRRNPTLALALGSVAALLVGVAAVSTWYSGRLSNQLNQTERAQQAERAANQSAQLRLWDAYLAEIAARNTSRQMGQRFAALEVADKAGALLDTIGRTDERVVQLRSAALNSLALSDFRRVRKIGNLPEDYEECALSLAADLYLTSTLGGDMVGCRLSDGQERFRIPHGGAFRPGISLGGQFVSISGETGVRIWRVDGSQPVLAWENPAARFFSFAPGGRHAAFGTAGADMQLVDLDSGATVRVLGPGEARSPFAFHADSRRIAVFGPQSVKVIAWDTGELVTEFPVKLMNSCRLAWHPGGRSLAIWNGGDDLALWDVNSGTKVITYQHPGYPWRLQFSPDGSRLLSYSLWDQRLILSDGDTGEKLLEVSAYANFVADVGPDGGVMLLRTQGTAAELWEFAPGLESRALAQGVHPSLGTRYRTSVSPDCRLLALSCQLGLEVWDLATRQKLAAWPCGICVAQFDSAGQLIVSYAGGVLRWPRQEHDAVAGGPGGAKRVVRFGPPVSLNGPVNPTSLAAGPVDHVMVFDERGGWTVRREVAPDEKLHLPVERFARMSAVSGDGRMVAVAKWDVGGATVWNTADASHLTNLVIGPHGVVTFSPDSRWLATTPDGVRLWRTADWQLSRELHAAGTTPNGLGIAFSPDSRMLAVIQPNGVWRFVSPETGADWAQLSCAELGCPTQAVFTPDQTRLITVPLEVRPARIWDLAAMRRGLAARGLDWPADVLAPRPAQPGAASLIVEIDDGGLIPATSPAAGED